MRAISLPHAVSHLGETQAHFIANALFKYQLAAVLHTRPFGLRTTAVPQAGLVGCLLGRKTKIYHIHHDLRVALWLEVAAHHTESHHGLPVTGHERRDNSVEWSFVRFQFIAMARIERERLAPVLHHKAHAVGTDLRTVTRVVTLNKRNHIACVVRCGEVNRVAVQFGVPVGNVGARTIGVDKGGALFCVFLRDQRLNGHVRKGGIRVVHRAILKGQFFRLGEEVQVFRRVGYHAANIKLLEDVQYL